jgi:hypothetical protein
MRVNVKGHPFGIHQAALELMDLKLKYIKWG